MVARRWGAGAGGWQDGTYNDLLASKYPKSARSPQICLPWWPWVRVKGARLVQAPREILHQDKGSSVGELKAGLMHAAHKPRHGACFRRAATDCIIPESVPSVRTSP